MDPQLLGLVALLVDLKDHRLFRGDVGTVVEIGSGDKVLVEFSDEAGHGLSIVAVDVDHLLVLRGLPEAA